jgi:hypothetical protein
VGSEILNNQPTDGKNDCLATPEIKEVFLLYFSCICMIRMINNNDPEKLLGQSKEEYAKYLENGESDSLAEAGELLWECLKADIAEVTNAKKNNINALMVAAAQRGETYNQLFYRCSHFHSWYLGGGVPNDFVAKRKLYLKTAKTLQKILERGNGRKAKRKVLENTA